MASNPPTEEFEALSREWAGLTSKYSTGRVWNKQHRGSTRKGVRAVVRAKKRSAKRKEQGEVRRDVEESDSGGK